MNKTIRQVYCDHRVYAVGDYAIKITPTQVVQKTEVALITSIEETTVDGQMSEVPAIEIFAAEPGNKPQLFAKFILLGQVVEYILIPA